MSRRPSVSVVVPVYNVSLYLDQCVQGICEQTFTDIEIVLVDDGSSDGSSEMCDRWAARDRRVRVIHQQNQGSSAARNVGIDVAAGDYIMFVDADDLVAPELVSTIHDWAIAHNSDLVVTGLTEFDVEEPYFTAASSFTVESGWRTLERIVCERPRWGPTAKLFRSNLFEQMRFPVGLVHQDLFLIPRVVAKASRSVFSDEVLYAYRQRPGSVMARSRQERSPDLITILRDNIEYSRKTLPKELFERMLVSYALHASKTVERINFGKNWWRNREFLRAYRGFARDYESELLRIGSLSRAYGLLWFVSARWPSGFLAITKLGRWIKKSAGVPGLTREAG